MHAAFHIYADLWLKRIVTRQLPIQISVIEWPDWRRATDLDPQPYRIRPWV